MSGRNEVTKEGGTAGYWYSDVPYWQWEFEHPAVFDVNGDGRPDEVAYVKHGHNPSEGLGAFQLLDDRTSGQFLKEHGEWFEWATRSALVRFVPVADAEFGVWKQPTLSSDDESVSREIIFFPRQTKFGDVAVAAAGSFVEGGIKGAVLGVLVGGAIAFLGGTPLALVFAGAASVGTSIHKSTEQFVKGEISAENYARFMGATAGVTIVGGVVSAKVVASGVASVEPTNVVPLFSRSNTSGPSGGGARIYVSRHSASVIRGNVVEVSDVVPRLRLVDLAETEAIPLPATVLDLPVIIPPVGDTDEKLAELLGITVGELHVQRNLRKHNQELHSLAMLEEAQGLVTGVLVGAYLNNLDESTRNKLLGWTTNSNPDAIRASAGSPIAVYDYHGMKKDEKTEVAALHGAFIEGGGWLLINPESSLSEILGALRDEQPIVTLGARYVFNSELWGEIDLSHLNNFGQHYQGNIGQAKLFRDLSVVLNRPRLGIANLRKSWGKRDDAGDKIFNERDWSYISISWREYLWLSRNIRWENYKGGVGYDRFATDHFQGDSLRAYVVASTLLTRDEFAALGWGKQKQTNVNEQEKVRSVLRTGLADGSYKGEVGYDKFATDHFQGNSQKAYQVASSLLTRDEFAALGWRKEKRTNVNEQEKVRSALRTGLADGSYKGEVGHDKFATDHFQGNSQKAYQVASSLLTRDEFAALGWGKEKRTNVNEQEKVRSVLRTGLADGSYQGGVGYDRFATDHFQGDSQKAYQVASALLTKEEFAALGWGKEKCINVNEQEKVRSALKSGLADGSYKGEVGYDRFAIDHFQGNSQKAYIVASALLTKEEFAAFGWGKEKFINVNEQEKVRSALRTGLADGSYQGGVGYDRFATDHFQGNSQKAYQVASSLLTKEEFAALGWGKQKHTKVPSAFTIFSD